MYLYEYAGTIFFCILRSCRNVFLHSISSCYVFLIFKFQLYIFLRYTFLDFTFLFNRFPIFIYFPVFTVLSYYFSSYELPTYNYVRKLLYCFYNNIIIIIITAVFFFFFVMFSVRARHVVRAGGEVHVAEIAKTTVDGRSGCHGERPAHGH